MDNETSLSTTFYGESRTIIEEGDALEGTYQPNIKDDYLWVPCHANFINDNGVPCRTYVCKRQDRAIHIKHCKQTVYTHPYLNITSPIWIEKGGVVPTILSVASQCKFTWRRPNRDTKPRKHIIFPQLSESHELSSQGSAAETLQLHSDMETDEQEINVETPSSPTLTTTSQINLPVATTTPFCAATQPLGNFSNLGNLGNNSIVSFNHGNGASVTKQMKGPLSKQFNTLKNKRKIDYRMHSITAKTLQDYCRDLRSNNEWISYTQYKHAYCNDAVKKGLLNREETGEVIMSSRDTDLLDMSFHLTRRYVNNNQFYKVEEFE